MGYQKIYRPLVGDNNHVVINQNAIDPGLGQYAVVTLTAAQIAAMFASPVPIVPAPGTGKAIIVDDMLIEYIAGTIAYTGGGGIGAVFHGTATVAHSGLVPASALTTLTPSNVQVGGPSGANGVTIPPNTGIDLTNLTAPFASGNGTLKIIICYVVVTL